MELVLTELERWRQRELNTKRPTIVFFLGDTKPLPWQARNSNAVLVSSGEMTGRTDPNTAMVAGGRKG
jgi:hypothetical protein